MSSTNLKPMFILLSGILLLLPCESRFASYVIDKQTGASYSYNDSGNRIKPEGYTSVIKYKDGFIAVGSDGRIDIISESGRVTKSDKFHEEHFNCILSNNQTIIAAGNKGAIMISSNNKTFKKIDSGTERNINSLVLFKGKIIAAADKGEILIGDDKGLFNKINLALKGNIVSVSARPSDCFGVTDEGEIIHSTDGVVWDIFDFNKHYSGYYKPCSFIKVVATKDQIAVVGRQNDGETILIFSTQGKVWTERNLNYTNDEGVVSYLTDTAYDLYYEKTMDQFILVCSKGMMMTIPSCSHCNKLYIISSVNLLGITGDDKTIMIVGENYFIKTLNTEWW